MVAERRLRAMLIILVAILLSTPLIWLAVNRMIERPLRKLIAGLKRLADSDFDFRFRVRGKDEIGLLEESFNDMTAKLASGLSELKETKDYLEGIVENSADIIITVNPAKLIQTFNTGAERILGYDREEVVGKNVETLFADPRERDAAIARLSDTDNIVNYETRFVTKGGEVRDVIVTLSRLRDGSGRSIGTFGISKDVTNEKRLQRQLIQSERLAAVGQALTGIQHSMKNMANALGGGSYLVRTGIAKNDQEMLKDGWRMVQEEIDNITTLSSNMLTYVREWKPEFKPADLGDVVTKICEVVAQTARDKGVSVRLDLPGALPLVRCDPNLIHSAMMDVASNAVEACLCKEYEEGRAPEVVIRASAAEDGSRVVLEVQDNGCGMSDEVRSNIFVPFFSTKRKTGTGLGLALVSRIVNVHGGAIGVESELGRGSVFRVLLPVHTLDKGGEDGDGEESAGCR
jgi:PAS domain S-box-containing protein